MDEKEAQVRGRIIGRALLDCCGGVVAANVAACVCIGLGIYLVSVLIFSQFPIDGITTQPASVQTGGADIQSLRYIIFRDSIFYPPPAPPSG